jgi:PleD family two-component response regulator
MDGAASSARLALVATADEWTAQELELVLAPGGYRVLRVASGAAVLERAPGVRPAFILLAPDVVDYDSAELCRALRRNAAVLSTPLIMLSAGPVTRQRRLAGLRAGAWDVVALPADGEELLLKLNVFLGAKQDLDQARESGLVDPATGLYNPGGMERRARELIADALRRHAALSCVALAAHPRTVGPGGAAPDATWAVVREHVGRVLKRRARTSDVVGWWDASACAILAPATDSRGAVQLGERLARVIESAPPDSGQPVVPVDVRGGYEVMSGSAAEAVDPESLLGRASIALRAARATPSGARIRAFAPEPG